MQLVTTTRKFLRAFATLSSAALAWLLPVQEAQAEPHSHDGFILQSSLTVGYASLSEKAVQDDLSEKYKYTGVTAAFDLLLGGTPVPGLALGGGLATRSLVDPTIENAGTKVDTADVSIDLDTITAFVQWYPTVTDGLFLGAQLGYGSASVEAGDVIYDTHTSGPVFSAIVGYEWWVGAEWSLGVAGQLAAAFLKGTNDGVESKLSWFSPTFGGVVTYH